MYNTETLHNGMRVIHLQRKGSQVVYCGIAVRAGARHEDVAGLAHFCEHTTFKGTQRLSSMQVINTLERVGGELNAFTTKEDTFYYSAVLKEHFNRAVDLLADIVFHSIYPQEELEKEVEVVCDEIESYNDTPADLIYDEFENVIFSNTALGHSILGESERVREFRTDDCLRYTRQHYVPSNCVFYVVGDVDFRRLVRRLENVTPQSEGNTSDLARRDTTVTTAEESSSKAAEPTLFGVAEANIRELNAKPVIRESETHQAHVMVGTVIPPLTDSHNQAVAVLLNNLLGGPSMNSRLNISLREKRGLVYSVDSSLVTYRDCRLWTTYFGCDPKDVNLCLRLVRSELAKLQKSPISSASLRAAKNQMRGQLALASENGENFAIDVAKQFLHRNSLKSNDRFFQLLDTVTSADIQAFVTRYLTEDRLVTMIMK